MTRWDPASRRRAMAAQSSVGTLFDDITGGGRHREHGFAHDAELQAAAGDRSGLRAKVLDAYRSAGADGLTDEQCAAVAGIERSHSAGTRREELMARGFPIRKTDRRRLTRAKRPAIVWCWIDAEA